MAFRDWFLIRTAPVRVKGEAIAAAEQGSVEGAFISPKSLASFPLAGGVVTILSKLLEHFFKVGDGAILYVALGVGLLIFLIGVQSADGRPKDPVGWVVAVLIGLVNSLLLAAAALGINTAILTGAK